MNLSKILNVLLALSLLILIIKVQVNMPKTHVSEETVNNKDIVIENIFSRKSVRSFTDKKVSDSDLEQLVKVGMAAPTAGNKQPWHFVVVTDRAVLDEFASNLQYAKMLKEAPAAIVVCGDTTKTFEGIEEEYWIQDCSAASENILLAVEAMKLGAVWTAFHPMPDRIALARKMLQLPEHIKPLNIIAIGYPKGDTPVKDKWNPEALHWQKW